MRRTPLPTLKTRETYLIKLMSSIESSTEIELPQVSSTVPTKSTPATPSMASRTCGEFLRVTQDTLKEQINGNQLETTTPDPLTEEFSYKKKVIFCDLFSYNDFII